ncbi:MAG: hypothetical protein Q9192_006502 [Flavoplaca navasiana]
MHQVLDTCTLALAYERCLHQQYAIQEDEKIRRLRVQLVQLETHNEALQRQIANNDDYVQELEQSQDALKAKIKEAGISLESTQGDVRIKSREIETLKAELGSLHGVTMDSTKLLTEKLALAREISTLRPEIDHLRSQVASNQTLLAQKLSLDHQLQTMKIQLENEQTSTRSILSKDAIERSGDARIESQLEILRAELGHERREKERVEREAQEASRTWEAQRMTLESRLELLRNKLRMTKESLKHTHQELNSGRPMPSHLVDGCAAPTQDRSTAMQSRKRTAAHMLSESMIGTPGDAPDDRKAKRKSTLPGDKSAFSITPYLSRTKSVGPESPLKANSAMVNVAETGQLPGGAQNSMGVTSNDHEAAPAAFSRGQTRKTLGTSTVGKAKGRVGTRQNKLKTASLLEQVAEEENDGTEENQGECCRANGPATGDGSILGVLEVKKPRRKLLGGPGKTLFDEDDRELGKSVPGAPNFAAPSKNAVSKPKIRPLMVASSTSGSFLGAFSPLKRNRQATGT